MTPERKKVLRAMVDAPPGANLGLIDAEWEELLREVLDALDASELQVEELETVRVSLHAATREFARAFAEAVRMPG